jgi:molybdate transport system regulatory protein
VDFSESCSIGPGKVGLLEAVDRTGSLSAAARALGLSYRRAWLLLHSVNSSFVDAAVEFSTGGKEGGGSRLTPFGRKLTRSYRDFESAVDALSAKSFADLKPGRATDGMQIRRPVQRSLGTKGVKSRPKSR